MSNVIQHIITIILIGIILFVGYLVMAEMKYQINEFCINKTDGNYTYTTNMIECRNHTGIIPATTIAT